MKSLIAAFSILLCGFAFAQQPQTASPDPQGLYGVNAKWTNGVGPGYWPYQLTGTCTGLNLCISAGTVPQCNGSNHVTYAGTTSFALTDNSTNYVYLDLDNSCVPAANTTGYDNRNIAIAKIVTASGAVTSLSDDRFWGSSHVLMGEVNAQTGTSYTIAAADRNKIVTLNNSSAVAVTLPTTLGFSFVVAIQNIGSGTATLTPSSGTINLASSVTLTGGSGSGGQGAWLFFDGTNWSAVLGGGSGGGNRIVECIVTTGDPGAASPVLANDNDSPAQCGNDFGADLTIVAVAGYADGGSPTVTPILTGGSGTSIVTGAITLSGAAWTAGTVNGTPVIHAFASNGATCPSTPCTLDSNITTAGGVAKYIVMKYTATTTGGTTTTMNLGTSSNHQVLYNNSGSVGGLANGTAGQVPTSQGSSSTPAFAGCLMSNGVNAQSASYALAAGDDGSLVTINASSATATLPNPPPNSTWCANIMNLSSSTNLTVSRNGLSINTGTSNLTLLPYQSVTIWTDGSNYFSTLPFSGVTTTASSQTPVINNVNGAAVPTSASVLGSNGSAQLVADTAHNVVAPLQCADTSSSSTTYTCTTTPSLGSLTTGDTFILTNINQGNSGSSTLNIDRIGAKTIKKWQNSANLAAGDLQANGTARLTYDGTNLELDTVGNAPSGGGGGCASGINNPGACLLEEHTISGAAEIDFTSCFSSSYNSYKLYLSITSTTSQDYALQFGTGGGPAWDTTSGHYEYSESWQYPGSSGSNNSTSDTGLWVYSNGGGTPSTLATNGRLSGEIIIDFAASGSFMKNASGQWNVNRSAGVTPLRYTMVGLWNQTTAATAIRFVTSTGTMSGVGQCYGINQ